MATHKPGDIQEADAGKAVHGMRVDMRKHLPCSSVAFATTSTCPSRSCVAAGALGSRSSSWRPEGAEGGTSTRTVAPGGTGGVEAAGHSARARKQGAQVWKVCHVELPSPAHA